MALFTRSFLFALCLLWTVVSARQLYPHQRHVSKRQLIPYLTNSTTSTNSTDLSNGTCYFWLEHVQHQGLAPFSGVPSYQVFRNVKDFGAVGDGVTDDTAAINLAVSSGNRCGPGTCNSTTTTPALVYFPAGTYLISSSVIDYYYTQLIGNPNCLPTLKATTNFTGLGLIDGDQYGANGLSFGATNVFWRQVRNFVLDMTAIPGSATGVHWPTGQATSLQNILFKMSADNGTQHQGVFIESGSGGFMTDLTFQGGLYGLNVGNQQFTMRNMTFDGCVTAINQFYDWGWTYAGMHINNCQVGLNFSGNGPSAQAVGSITFFDSDISNTPVGFLTAFNNPNGKYTNGSLILENVKLDNVPVAVQGPNGTLLSGSSGSSVITAWGQGHAYTPSGPQGFQGPITPNSRPASLLSGDAFYTRSKPQYESYTADQFISARTIGARGDGSTDDTAALQAAITAASQTGKVLYIDAGDYKVSTTVYIPAGTTIVGEAYPVIIGYGPWFTDINNPRPIIQIGKPGEQGTIEWSDTIVSTQGATAGAILFEYNLASGAPGSGSLEKRQGWESWSSGSSTSNAASYPQTSLSSVSPTVTSQNGHAQPSGVYSSGANNGGPHSQSGSGGHNSNGDGSSGWDSEYSSTTDYYGTSGTHSYTVSGGPSGTVAPGGSSSWGSWNGGSGAPNGPTSTPHPGASGGPSGLWDVHARVGGFAGSNLQIGDCPTTPQIATPPAPVDASCIAAFMTMHITSSASNVYLENVWLWVADHDVEDPQLRQITVYAGRGLLIESAGPLWLWGTAVEHHTLYEYQLVSAAEIYMGQIQTETAYYQPNPPATIPFPVNPAYHDPDFSTQCYATSGFNFTSSTNFTNNCDGYALRIIDSSDILVYGAGLYSFFDNYNTSCSAPSVPPGGAYGCQTHIFSIEGTNKNIDVYNLNTVGAQSMVDVDGQSIASYLDNLNVFIDGIALLRPEGDGGLRKKRAYEGPLHREQK